MNIQVFRYSSPTGVPSATGLTAITVALSSTVVTSSVDALLFELSPTMIESSLVGILLVLLAWTIYAKKLAIYTIKNIYTIDDILNLGFFFLPLDFLPLEVFPLLWETFLASFELFCCDIILYTSFLSNTFKFF